MAGSPRAIADAPAEQRRRWVLAAAATGVMITGPAVVGKAAELPDGWHEARAELPYAAFVGAWQEPDVATLVGPRPTAQRPLLIDAPSTALGEVAGATGGASDDGAGELAAAVEAAETEAVEPSTPDLGALPDGVVELARYADVVVAAEGADVELVGFHESSTATALELTSVHPVVSSHPSVPGGVSDDDGPVVVLPPRHRAGEPTSAIDLSVTAGSTVVAPISGEVVQVADYALYGATRDLLVQIRSDEDPSIVAHVHHLVGAQVQVGDSVEAGRTPLAEEARILPFESQVDRFTVAHRGEASPHVHIELRPG